MLQAQGFREIVSYMQELRKVSEDELGSIEEDIRKEAKEDADLRSQYTGRWNRPSSIALNSQINEKIGGGFPDQTFHPVILLVCV